MGRPVAARPDPVEPTAPRTELTIHAQLRVTSPSRAESSTSAPFLDQFLDPRALRTAATAVDGSAEAALRLAVPLTAALPLPASGRTADRWQALAALADGDVTAGRVLEAHTDAVAILAEAIADPHADWDDRRLADIGVDAAGPWGVFAAEGREGRVSATETAQGWRLSGIKPWCSLADRLPAALVTAFTGERARRLFAVNLRHPGVRVRTGTWRARGLTDVPSGPIELADVPAVPVGDDGWYLCRPGFAWGGIGVAACWYGGAVGLARSLADAARANPQRPADQIALAHLGAVDATLTAARSVLTTAAATVDAGHWDGPDAGTEAARLALRVRAVVASTVEDVLTRVGHSLGPAPLAQDERHARRVADLQLYVRQHHAERDAAALGRAVLDLDTWPGVDLLAAPRSADPAASTVRSPSPERPA